MRLLLKQLNNYKKLHLKYWNIFMGRKPQETSIFVNN